MFSTTGYSWWINQVFNSLKLNSYPSGQRLQCSNQRAGSGVFRLLCRLVPARQPQSALLPPCLWAAWRSAVPHIVYGSVHRWSKTPRDFEASVPCGMQQSLPQRCDPDAGSNQSPMLHCSGHHLRQQGHKGQPGTIVVGQGSLTCVVPPLPCGGRKLLAPLWPVSLISDGRMPE